MKLKNAITFAHEGSLTATATTRAAWETARGMEIHDQEDDNVESEEGERFPKTRNFFISSEFP